MVSTPTDTTQLGYYYQRVPVWQPRNGMIPPVPHPEAFHVPDFGGGCKNVCHNGLYGSGAWGHQGGIISDSAVGSAPTESNSVPTEATPQEAAPPAPATPPVPDSTDAVPPAPAPEAPPAETAPVLEKSALAPFLYTIPPQ